MLATRGPGGKMNKKEKAAVVALLGIALVAVCVFMSCRYVQKREADKEVMQVAAKGEQETQTHEVGEAFELTGENPDFGTYRSSLGWVGTMGITINGIKAWSNATDGEIRGKLAKYPEKILEKNGYVELTFTLQNIDAITTGATGHSNHPEWFHSGSFRLCDTNGEQAGSAVCFTGTPEEATDGEQFYYDLPQGQSATYTIGYLVEKSAVPNPNDVSQYVVHLGINDTYGSCTIPLGENS